LLPHWATRNHSGVFRLMPMLPSDQTGDGFHCYTYTVEVAAALGDDIHVDAGVKVSSLSSKQGGDETSAAARHRDRLADRAVEMNGDEINRAHELAGAAGSATKDAQSRRMKIRRPSGWYLAYSCISMRLLSRLTRFRCSRGNAEPAGNPAVPPSRCWSLATKI
jgi:hypothetical protein